MSLIRRLNNKSGNRPIATAPQLTQLQVDMHFLPLDEKSPFVQPVPLKTIQTWLRETRVWKEGEGFGKHDISSLNNEWWNANVIANDLSIYAQEPEIVTRAGLQQRMAFTPKITNRFGNWHSLEYAFESLDETLPHISAISTVDYTLPENQLGFFELFVLLCLTKLQIREGRVKDLEKEPVPVTIISIGDCTVRILHGWIDIRTQRVIVYKSPVMSFEEPGLYMKENWSRLLCWLLAKPLRLFRWMIYTTSGWSRRRPQQPRPGSDGPGSR